VGAHIRADGDHDGCSGAVWRHKNFIGQLQALFNTVAQNRSTLSMLSSCREKMKIATDLVNELADLLNDSTDVFMEQAANSRRQQTVVRRMCKELDMDPVFIGIFRVHYASSMQHDVYNRSLELTIDGLLPIGSVIGLASRDSSRTDPQSQQLALQHSVIIDLLAGTRTPKDGAVVVPAHLTVGVVPQELMFLGGATLFENLTAGCGDHFPERIVWRVCHAVGLPPHMFNTTVGKQPMEYIPLTPDFKQLVAIVRALLSQPDVLLVHHCGTIEPRIARRLSSVFNMYAKGVSLALISGAFAEAPLDHDLDAQDAADAVESDAQSQVRWASQTDLDVDAPVNGAATEGATSTDASKETALAYGDSIEIAQGQRARYQKVVTMPRDKALIYYSHQAQRRTVIWHSSTDVLLTAQVRRVFAFSRGRLQPYEYQEGAARSGSTVAVQLERMDQGARLLKQATSARRINEGVSQPSPAQPSTISHV